MHDEVSSHKCCLCRWMKTKKIKMKENILILMLMLIMNGIVLCSKLLLIFRLLSFTMLNSLPYVCSNSTPSRLKMEFVESVANDKVSLSISS